jgi:hypothetical protein
MPSPHSLEYSFVAMLMSDEENNPCNVLGFPNSPM